MTAFRQAQVVALDMIVRAQMVRALGPSLAVALSLPWAAPNQQDWYQSPFEGIISAMPDPRALVTSACWTCHPLHVEAVLTKAHTSPASDRGPSTSRRKGVGSPF